MTESAWATARTRTRPGARFRRLARRFGKDHEKKAAIAVAHTLICIAWAVMARGQDYADAGEDYYDRGDQRNREHRRHHQQALARLGCQVTLVPPGDDSPPPGTASPHPPTPPQGQAA
jgi:transposase